MTRAGPSRDTSRRSDAAWLVVSVVLAGVLVGGCEIAPIVSTSEPTARYGDCERAAEDYCEHVVDPKGSDLDRCVAEHRYKCVAGTP